LEASVGRSRRPDRRTVIAWIVAAPWLLWAVVRGFGLEFGFPLVPLMAYTPFVAVAVVIPLVVTLLLRRWVAAESVALAGLVLVAVLVPRATGSADEPRPGSVELNVVSANIYRGKADMAELMKIVRGTDADLLSVQELNRSAMERLDRLGLRRLFPYRADVYAGGPFGGGLFSRFPLQEVAPLRTPPRVGPRDEAIKMPRALVRVPGAAMLDAVAVHPAAPTGSHVGDWEHAMGVFPTALQGPQRLLIGDFNGTLDMDAFRELLAKGYRDAGDVMGKGLVPTWRAGSILPPPVTIDHVLADERIGVGEYAVHSLEGSDHKTISATLFLPRQAG